MFHVHIDALVPRTVVHQVLHEHFLQQPEVSSYIALEMELANSGVIMRNLNQKRIDVATGEPMDNRHDHYLFYKE